MDAKGQERKQQDRAGDREKLARWAARWGADILLVLGAGCVAVGVGWIFPPAGVIAAGVLLIIGGVLWARGSGGS